jgi:adenosine kinase
MVERRERNEHGGDGPRVVVSASLAYDYIMTFPGSFKDHIIPDKVHVLSVSFLVDSLRRHRGGVGGNIAYNLSLLGEPPYLVGAAGLDFGPYRDTLHELGVDTGAVLEVADEFTASCFFNTDLSGNQIVAFYPGAGSHAREVDIAELARRSAIGIVGADDPAAMRRHVAEIAASDCKLIYDPSQQIVTLGAEDLVDGVHRAWGFVANDYEVAMIAKKAEMTVEALTERVPFVAVTYGGEGSELRYQGQVVRIPPAPAEPLRDPTGGGDAYRAGLIKGLLHDFELPVVGRIASLAATYAIEKFGTQEHRYRPDEFVARFDRAFPDFAGALNPDDFRPPKPATTALAAPALRA